MKKFTIILSIILALNSLNIMQATPQETTMEQNDESCNIQNEFYGCKLGQSNMKEVKNALQARRLNVMENEDSYVITDAMLDGLTFSAALFQFNEQGMLNSVTFLNSGLSKDQAILFGQSIYKSLNEKYIMIKRVIDGFDCYFSSANDLTCQLSTQAGGDTYFVRLDYQVGSAVLEQP